MIWKRIKKSDNSFQVIRERAVRKSMLQLEMKGYLLNEREVAILDRGVVNSLGETLDFLNDKRAMQKAVGE